MVAPTYLRSLQALELAVREGSFVGAGEALGITPAAVGQRVKALEDYLGVELLARGRNGLRPTRELEPALAHLRRAFAELEAAARELELQQGQEIHIAAASDLAELWLKPRLAQFRDMHPNIRFCINGEGDAPARLGRSDCEISYGSVREDSQADLLFRDFVLPLASPVNVARTADLAPEDRLEGFPLVHVDFYKDDPAGLSWAVWTAAADVVRSAPERGMRFQRITAAMDAVNANAGVALCGVALLRERLEDGTLELPYPAALGRWSEHGFVARFRADAEGRRHVQRFRTWLGDEARATADWVSGLADA